MSFRKDDSVLIAARIAFTAVICKAGMIEYVPQPRSQALSSLAPVVVGRKTLVAASQVTTCDTNFSMGGESTKFF